MTTIEPLHVVASEHLMLMVQHPDDEGRHDVQMADVDSQPNIRLGYLLDGPDGWQDWLPGESDRGNRGAAKGSTLEQAAFALYRRWGMWDKRPPSLRVEVSVEIRTEQTVDLVTMFQGFNVHEREAYWDLAKSKVGREFADYEKPITYLYSLTSGVDADLHLPGGTTGEHSTSDQTDWHVLVRQRADSPSTVSTGWSERDYHALLLAVPWMVPTENDTEDAELVHRTERLPGPNDSPMF